MPSAMHDDELTPTKKPRMLHDNTPATTTTTPATTTTTPAKTTTTPATTTTTPATTTTTLATTTTTPAQPRTKPTPSPFRSADRPFNNPFQTSNLVKRKSALPTITGSHLAKVVCTAGPLVCVKHLAPIESGGGSSSKTTITILGWVEYVNATTDEMGIAPLEISIEAGDIYESCIRLLRSVMVFDGDDDFITRYFVLFDTLISLNDVWVLTNDNINTPPLIDTCNLALEKMAGISSKNCEEGKKKLKSIRDELYTKFAVQLADKRFVGDDAMSHDGNVGGMGPGDGAAESDGGAEIPGGEAGDPGGGAEEPGADGNVLEENRQEPPFDAPEVVKEVFNIIRNDLRLLQSIRFNLLQLLMRIHVHLTADSTEGEIPDDDRISRQMYGGGRTQAGKTVLKLCTAILAHRMGYATVLISPTDKNCKELTEKFRSYLYRAPELLKENKIPCTTSLKSPKDMGGFTMKIENFFDVNKGGVLIVNYNHSQIAKAHKAEFLARYEAKNSIVRKYIVLLDEADELFKNEDQDHKNRQEVELETLILNTYSKSHAGLIFYVTATMLPVLLRSVTADLNIDVADIIDLIPVSQYIRPENDFHVWGSDDQGNGGIFLAPKELNYQNCFINDAVKDFCREAVNNVPVGMTQSKALIVDVTDPRVGAIGGLFNKINQLGQDLGPNFVGIALYGLGSKVLYFKDGKENAMWFKRNVGISKLIDYIERCPPNEIGGNDMVIDGLNWDGPIIVVGYSVLIRGLSVRNNKRVPTHLIHMLSPGMNMEKIIQAMGRATGDMRKQLKDLGYDRVEVLFSENDQEIAETIPQFMEAFKQALVTLHGQARSAMRAALGKINIFELGRTIGPKGMRYVQRLKEMFPEILPQIPDDLIFSEYSAKEVKDLCTKYAVDAKPGFGTKFDLVDALETARSTRRKNVPVPQADANVEE